MWLYYLFFILVSLVVPTVSEGENFLKVLVMSFKFIAWLSGSGDDIIGLLVLKPLNLKSLTYS
jgi:hypothetical protein